MAKQFNLTANLQIRGPIGADAVIRSLNSKFKNVNATIDLKLGSTAKDIKRIEADFRRFNTTLGQTTEVATRATSALSGLASSLSTAKFSQVSSQINTAGTAITGLGTSFRKTTKDIDAATFSAAKFGKDSALALKRFAAFTIPTTFFFGITAGFAAGLKSAIDFERQMVRVAQTVKQPLTAISGLQGTITKLSTDLGVSSAKLADISLILAQAGLTAKDTQIVLASLAKTELSASFENIIDTTDGVIAAMRQFEIQATGVEDLLNSINEVSARYAVESSDIITAIQKTGGAFKAAGGNVNELIALFSSIRETTRESGDTIATGIRTIVGRLQRVETITALSELGVELRDATGEFVGVFEAFQRIGVVLSQKSTTSEVFASIVEQIGGLRQLSRVIPAITQYAKAQEILNVAQEKNNSLNQAAQRAQESLSVQLDRLRESFVALFREITDNEFFKIVSRGFVDATIGATKLIDALEPLIPIIGGLALVKLGQGLGSVGQFFRGFAGFFAGGEEISSEEKLNAILNERSKIQAKISKEKERAADKERRIIERAKKDELTAIKEKKAAERELERRRDKSIRFERQNRLDSQRATEVQQKLELERQKIAARTGAGATEGAAANAAVIQKNTASVLVLTKAIEALTAATVKGTGGAGRTRTGQTGGSSQQVFRDPQTGRIISRGEAQRIGNLTPGSGVIFAGPSGVAGEDIREVRRRDRAERLRRQAETRPLQRPPTLLLPGPTTAPGLQIATGGGFAAIQQANRPRATANFLADQSFKLAEREIASRDFPFGKVVPRTTTAAVRPVAEFERIVSGALDNFKPKRPIRPIPVSVTQGLGFSFSTQASTSAEELNRQADAEASRRARNTRIGRGVGLTAALALPSLIDIFADREGSIQNAQNLRVDSGSAIASARRQAGLGAVGTGISAGVSAGFLLGPLGGAAVGLSAFVSDLLASTERLQKEVIEGRLVNAINAVSDTLKDFDNNLASSNDVLNSFRDLGLASNVALEAAGQNETLFGTVSSAFSDFANKVSPFDSRFQLAGQVGNTFEGLGFAESIIPSIQGLFGGTQFEDLKRNRKQANDLAIQQTGAATAELATVQLGGLIKRAARRTGTSEGIQSDELIQGLLSQQGVRLALASQNRAGRRFIAEGNTDAALRVGEAEGNRILEQRSALELKLVGIHQQQIKTLELSARTLNAFNKRIDDINNRFESFDNRVANLNSSFEGLARLSSGGSVAALASGRINTSTQGNNALSVVGGFLGSGARRRLEELQGSSGVLQGITDALIEAGRGRIGESTSIDTLRLGGTDEAPVFLKDFIAGLSDVDQARIRSALGGENAVGEELKRLIENITADAGAGAQSRLESLNSPEFKLFTDSLNRINGILSTYASNLDTINGIIDHSIDVQNRIADIEAQRAQNAARFRATAAGREFVPNVNEALGPVRQRLGAFAFKSPQGIRDRAATTFSRITALQTELEKARRAEQVAPGTGAGRISEIIRELDPLNRSFRDARQALELLSRDTTELALKEQQLSKVVADREARESFNRNFAGASPIDQLKQALGVRTLVGAAQRGSFLNAKEARQGLSAASGLGDTFRINGEAIRTLIPRLLEASGLNFLPAGVTPEEGKLEAERDALLKRQVDALEKLKELDNIQIGELRLQNNATERLIISLNNLANEISTNNPVRRAGGGVIPGSGNSDSVHALLTPGEYVLRKDAVRRIGLGALNRLNGVQRFANGGQVLPGATTNNVILPSINTQQMLTAINQFSNSVNILSQSLANFVPDITFTGHHTVDVRILGAEVLTTIQPAIQELINNQITGSIRKLILDRFPESGPV